MANSKHSDPLAPARERGRKLKAKALRRRDMLTLSEVAAALLIAEPEVLELSDQGHLLMLDDGTERRWPAWQILEDGNILPGLPEVQRNVPSPWIAYFFLTAYHPSIGCSPLAALQSGRPGDALRAADARIGFECPSWLPGLMTGA